jgi:hypothetical protein
MVASMTGSRRDRSGRVRFTVGSRELGLSDQLGT